MPREMTWPIALPAEPSASALRGGQARWYVRAMEPGEDSASAAIEALLDRFRAMVRSVGAQRGLLEADLDELIQEVRIRLWRVSQGGKDLRDLGSSYLYQVATTATLDLLRRRRARAADRTEDVADREDIQAPDPSPQEHAEAGDLATRIDGELESLSLDRRVAVRFHLAGYDRHDMARALGWSEARTRNLLYRGLEELRRRLALIGVAPTWER